MAQLTLLHFNDLHGRLDQLPRLFTLIQRARLAASAALLFDCGDSSDPHVWESNLTQGRANYLLLEAMGVQAGAVGNNEAGRFGPGALARLVQRVHFPLLAANLVAAGSPDQPAVPGLQRSVVLPCGSYQVGVLGAVAAFNHIYEHSGYTALDPLPVIEREAHALRAQGARPIVLLSHLGLELDLALGARLPEVDVILGGHSHSTLFTPLRAGQAVVAQAGEHGRFLGTLRLDLDTDGRVRDFSGALIPCDDSVPPDPTISATLEFVREEAARLAPSP